MFANVLFAVMTLTSVACWGPLPVGCLWIGSRVLYETGNTGISLLAAFASMLVVLLGALALMARLDDLWVLFRRAGGNDQRSGAFSRIFGVAAIVSAAVLAFWFVVIHGPGSQVFPGNRPEIE